MQNIYNLFDEHPIIPLTLAVVFVLMVIMKRRAERAQKTAVDIPSALSNRQPEDPPNEQPANALDTPLFHWTPRDPFRVRDLLNGGALILGRAGSGKTSSSGRTLMQAIVRNPQSGGLILAAKPEDIHDVVRIFKKADQLQKLRIFEWDRESRCNFLGCLKRPRDVVTFLTTMSEVMKRVDSKGGGDNNRFYDAQEERCIYNAVAALQAAKEPLTAPNIHKFIMTAATTPEQMMTAEWQAKYHSKVLDTGFEAEKNPLDEHDYKLCFDFWTKEWPGLMDHKTRGNILAGVQGTLHNMNTGIVREMCSGETNFSPTDILAGKWLLVNFAPSAWGAAGQLISAGWKQLVELAILERHAREDSPFITIWCDEAHGVTTVFDAVSFIPQCRSHKGCLVYLTQSVSSFYAALHGDAGKHQADALLANFSHVIVHASDPVTAKWASSKLGRKKEILSGGSSSPSADSTPFDMLYGNNHTSASFSEHYEQVLQDQEFMIGRTGGPDNDFC